MYKYTYTYIHIHIHIRKFFCKNKIVIFERCILRFPEFQKVPLFAAVSLSPDNRDTIFSQKLTKNLFQKQHNCLALKSFYNISNI